MPAMRKYSSRRRPRYRSSYRRRRGKYRQQLLSVNTVKKIAKKVAKKLPELKRAEIYQPQLYIGNPSSTRVHVQCLADSNLITKGDAMDERIGNRITIVGFQLRCQCMNASAAQQYVHVVFRVVKFNGPLPPTITATNTPDHWLVVPGMLQETHNKQHLTTIWSKTVKFGTNGTEDWVRNATTGVWSRVAVNNQYVMSIPKIALLKEFIKVGKRQEYLDSNLTQEFRSNYYLMVHAYAKDQNLTANNYWNGGNMSSGTSNDQLFNPSISYRINTLYRDA